MKRVSRFLSPWKVLIAVVAIAASAPSAKADIYLQVTDLGQGSTTHPTAYYDLTAAGPGYVISATAGNAGVLNGGSNLPTGPLGTASFVVTANQTSDATQLALSLTASIAVGTGSGQYLLSLFSSNYAGAFTQGQAATPTSTGLFTSPGVTGAQGYLQTSLSNITASDGFTLAAQSTYTGFGTNSTSSFGISTQTLTVSSNSPTPLTLAGPFAGVIKSLGARADNFDISSNDVNIQLAQGDTLTFTSTATFSLPEPSGVVAAFAGLPCVGMLLGYARRLRGRPAPEAAA